MLRTAASPPTVGAQVAAATFHRRMQVLSLARVFGAIGVLAMLLAASPSGGAARALEVVGIVTVAYLAVTAGAFVLQRSFPSSSSWILDLSLPADAAWGAVVLWATGGPFSPFIFVLYVQVVAMTVLFAWRTGLKLVAAHTVAIALLVFVFDGGAGTNVSVEALPVILAPVDGQTLTEQALLAILSLWILGAGTGYLSLVNERDLRSSNRELAALRELNTDLERSLDLDDVSEAIASGVVRQLGYERSVVWMPDDGGDLVAGGAEGFTPDALEVLAELRLSLGEAGPVDDAIEARAPHLVARDDPRPIALADAFEIDSALVLVPLVSEGRLLGLLSVEVAAPLGRAPQVTGRDLRILGTLATEAGLALDNARLHAELRDLSVTDALTGVYNHRYFQQRLQEELDRSLRRTADGEEHPVSLVLMDIDYFKRVNDRFGHPSGDELLRSFSRLTQRVVRSTDTVCRYGGEEFAIILPDTTSSQAIQVAERLREAIQRSSFAGSAGRSLGNITASFGVATHDAGVPSRSDLVESADEALYEAKETGRNRVVHADHRLRDGDEMVVPA